MENILLVMNGTKPDMCTVDFACYTAALTHSALRVLLGAGIKENDKPVQKEVFALPYVETIVADDIPENKNIRTWVTENGKRVGDACMNRNVHYTVRENFKISPSEIIAESRFADLIIMNPETSTSEKNEGSPTRFVKEILNASECPVILSPYSFEGISEIVFPYDGSEDAVFAIKQFAHLFPALNTKPVTVIHIDQHGSQSLPKTDQLMKLLTAHYSNLKFENLTGEPANELFNYLLGKKDRFVVMGAFGRNTVSNILRHSTAALSLQTINLPFFIAHHPK